MRKTLFALPCMAAIALAAFVGMRTLERNKNINETLLMANVEALTEGEEPSWWDFFNNYYVEERIPINTTTCRNGTLNYKGITITGCSCTQYTYAIYRHRYDGGHDDLCTSSHVHEYI